MTPPPPPPAPPNKKFVIGCSLLDFGACQRRCDRENAEARAKWERDTDNWTHQRVCDRIERETKLLCDELDAKIKAAQPARHRPDETVEPLGKPARSDIWQRVYNAAIFAGIERGEPYGTLPAKASDLADHAEGVANKADWCTPAKEPKQ